MGRMVSSFVKTGFLLAKDGSENGKVELWARSRGRTPVGPDGQLYNFD